MKILFSMRHSGALRNFASTLRALDAAGHRIHLVFMRPDKRGDGRLLRELTDECPQMSAVWVSDGKAPRRWSALLRGVRTGGDYVRYWTSEYASASALRSRAASRVPPLLRRVIESAPFRTARGLALARRTLAFAEQSIPADPRIVDLLAAENPDIVLVTPLVDIGSAQVDYLKAARELGIRTGLAVHSWDNLTNKGVLRVIPDRVFVWNHAQKREAVTMHHVEPERVVVTGAPVYDQWFSREPSTTRAEFCGRVGLRADRPFILYLCSSAFIAADEAAFVAKWIAAVRSAPDARLRDVGILVRPHPDNPTPWIDFDASQFPDVAVWPRDGSEPIDKATKNDYFDSIYHAVAAVGINTSAQIEAGIIGRPVYTIRVPEYAGTQDGTRHFHYLATEQGGLLHVADGFDEHVRDLAQAVATAGACGRAVTGFVGAFVRPHGITEPATPRLAAAIEELGALPKPEPVGASAAAYVVRAILYPFAALATAAQARERRRRTHKSRAELSPSSSGQRLPVR